VFRENFSCKNELKEKALREIGEGLKAVFPAHIEFSRVDGVRLVLENGWLLVRPSGTEPTMRLTVEGESLKAANQIMQRGAELIKNTIGNGGR
jgi:phosphoglucosamine mutase